jgi:hypothetical protein
MKQFQWMILLEKSVLHDLTAARCRVGGMRENPPRYQHLPPTRFQLSLVESSAR